jgi:hypothetical protein
VLILKEVKVICFDTLLQVLILKEFGGAVLPPIFPDEGPDGTKRARPSHSQCNALERGEGLGGGEANYFTKTLYQGGNSIVKKKLEV